MGLRLGVVDRLEQGLEVAAFHVDFAIGDLADDINQVFRRVVLVKDAGNSGLDQVHRFAFADAGGDHEDAAGERRVDLFEEIQGAFNAEVHVQENDVGSGFAHQRKRLGN